MTTATATHIDRVQDIAAHRIKSPRVEGDWMIWDCNVSVQTMGKFVARAKAAGYRSAFVRPGRFGVHLDDIDEG